MRRVLFYHGFASLLLAAIRGRGSRLTVSCSAWHERERAVCSANPQSSRFCWACSIPDDVWLRLAMLSCTVAYDIGADDVLVIQPVPAQAADTRCARER